MSHVHEVLGSYCSLMRMLNHVVKQCRKLDNVNACVERKLEFKSHCLKVYGHTKRWGFCTVYQPLMNTEELKKVISELPSKVVWSGCGKGGRGVIIIW